MICPVAAKTSPTPVLAWLEPSQQPLLEAVAARAKLRIVGAGSPASSARAGAIRIEGAQEFTDLRSVLTSTEAAAVLLMTGAGAEPIAATGEQSPLRDAELLRLCQSRSMAVLPLEPLPSSAADLAALAPAANSEHWGWTPMLPLLARSRVFFDAAEALQAFGPPRTLSISFWSGPGQGSLASRLFDASLLAHTLLGVPESIDASVVTRVSVSGVRMAPGETLRDLRGDLTANLRYAGAKAASFSLSDRGGRWFRGVSIVGDAGRLRFDEKCFEHITVEGTTADSSAPPRRRSGSAAVPPELADVGAAEAIAEAISRALDPHALKAPPLDLAAVLATCDAAILSARTGQPESPATILRMAGST